MEEDRVCSVQDFNYLVGQYISDYDEVLESFQPFEVTRVEIRERKKMAEVVCYWATLSRGKVCS